MRLRRVSPRWLWLVLVVLAAGCDNTVTRPDPITIDLNGSTGAAPSFTNHTFTSDRRGIARVTLRWTTGDLDFFATVGSCTTDPFTCGSRVQAETVNTTEEVITFGVTDQEVIRLWVLNFSAPAAHAYTIEVRLE
jgi:hypothetical protein